MSTIITSGSLCKCSFGAAPMPFNVLPTNLVIGGAMPVATIMDYIPIVNIPTFGVCTNPANIPQVCVPTIATPWIPMAPHVLVKTFPILTKDSMAFCTLWGGIIQFITSSQFTIST